MFFKKSLKIFIISLIFLFVGSNVFAGTFGWSGGGLNAVEFMDNKLLGTEFTLSDDDVQIQSVSAYIEFIGNSEVKVGIYDSDDNFVAGSNPYINTAGALPDAWFDFTFTAKPTLASGDYWLLITANNQNSLIHLEDATSDLTYFSTSTFNGFPATFDNPQLETNNNVGLLATYRTPYITVQSGFATQTLAYAGQLFTDLSIPIILIIGLPMAFWVIKKIIALV